MNNEKVQDARFIIASKALSDAFEHGFVKVHGSVMQLEKYKNYFLEDIDQLSKKFVRTKTLVLDSGKSANVEIPNVMIYSEPKHTFLIRTNVNKIYSLSRVANEVINEELAKAFYHYFDSIYSKNISL